jgi:hypothetical protein|nr:hypothetical protein [Kofleriaceae bacterium]
MVEALGTLMLLGGLGMMAIGAVWFVIAAFREHILWGLGVLFVPLVPLAFLIAEWPVAKRPFFWQLWGIVTVVAAMFVLGGDSWVHHHILHTR